MEVWNSAFELYSYSESVPEVVGSPEEVIRCGIEVQQKEFTPPPKCKEAGYTPLEWMQHWARTIGRGILRIQAEVIRRDCVSLTKKHKRA